MDACFLSKDVTDHLVALCDNARYYSEEAAIFLYADVKYDVINDDVSVLVRLDENQPKYDAQELEKLKDQIFNNIVNRAQSSYRKRPMTQNRDFF